MEQLEEETEVKRAVERQVSSLNMQVSSPKQSFQRPTGIFPNA